MKVCHHGSSHQSEGLFVALHPKIAFISVGKDNPYGHPSLATIHTLETLGAHVYRTDRAGAISISPDLDIHTHGRELFTVR